MSFTHKLYPIYHLQARLPIPSFSPEAISFQG